MPEVNVDKEIYNTLSTRAGEKGFPNTEKYVNYLLEQVAEKIETKTEEQEEELSEEDKEKVKEKLRGLGYLD